MQVTRTHHVGITVPSLSEAVAALRRAGFRVDLEADARGEDVAKGNGLPDADMRVAFLSGRAGSIELIEHRNEGGKEPPSNGETGFAELGLPAAVGAAVDLEALAIGVKLGRPSGRMELHWTSPSPSLTATTLSRFGLETNPREGGMVESVCDHLTVILTPAIATGPPPRPNDLGRVHVCFEVDDLATAHSQLVAAGVEFVSEPLLHEESDLRWVFARDPGGVGELELVQPGS